MEKLPSGDDLRKIREFSVLGLAWTVPDYLSPNQAVEIIEEWFPGDKLAVESLYKAIYAKKP